jgi:N-hydroxyarylamine O-acetyltransferase
MRLGMICDLPSYLARIGLATAPAATPQGLEQVQRAHRQSIGFENLDVMLGRGIALAPEAIRGKLVDRRRGGYCFEHNRLFGAMLATMGMPTRPLLARVWLRAAPGVMTARTHTFSLVTLGSEPWLADAGFGSSYVPPMPLVDGTTALAADGYRHRLRRARAPGALRGEWEVERSLDGTAWEAQYSFDTNEVAALDLEMSNHWVATRPESRFTQACIVSIVQPEGFASLLDRQMTVHTATTRTVTELPDATAWQRILAEVFQIELDDAEVGQLAPRLFG